ncbi:HNH endonuclease [Kocuria carniphila]|uniref:HNH endonuclease n=1 Tax=Kocuria carniphila TaxID=262208 RepID=UPI0034CD9B30
MSYLLCLNSVERNLQPFDKVSPQTVHWKDVVIVRNRTCIESGCISGVTARQRCLRHYQRWRRVNLSEKCQFCAYITVSHLPAGRRNGRVLTVDGRRRVVCRRHLSTLLRENHIENLRRLGDRIDIDPLSEWDCWLLHSRNDYGYSRIHPVGCRQYVYAHHFSYALFVGGYRNGQQIHHRCQRPECVNPAHLEALTAKQHVARARSKPTMTPLPTFRNSDGYALTAGFAREYGLPFGALADVEELTAA